MSSGAGAATRPQFEAWARKHLESTEPMASDLRNRPYMLASWFELDASRPDRYRCPWTDAAWSGWLGAKGC